jgi:hypothetical protein
VHVTVDSGKAIDIKSNDLVSNLEVLIMRTIQCASAMQGLS